MTIELDRSVQNLPPLLEAVAITNTDQEGWASLSEVIGDDLDGEEAQASMFGVRYRGTQHLKVCRRLDDANHTGGFRFDQGQSTPHENWPYEYLVSTSNTVVADYATKCLSLPGRHIYRAGPIAYPSVGLYTHVLLAACRPDQTSCEAKYQGHFYRYFTATLLEALSGIELPRTSYMALIAKIDAITAARKGVVQIAQCEGNNKGSVLFDDKALGIERCLVPCSFEGPGVVEIETGEIHGVRKGTRFGVYPENTWADKELRTKEKRGEGQPCLKTKGSRR
ncbi:hypothetical protein JAAARDRAFT_211961 [Jaapia argillacea MUCL 33604]|uniref:Uncharacterized protein n=1 Tax=Jaapia argillacea MUCL 33604 TaxID=933084 RepID=A0A067PG34_9AGAM|nr:hypothetical protein JAAARDRAFT_211961 [Jaapia argillacea MUCL 33604]